MSKKNAPFEIKDCTLIALATGVRAQNLRELRDKIEIIEQGDFNNQYKGQQFEEQNPFRLGHGKFKAHQVRRQEGSTQ